MNTVLDDECDKCGKKRLKTVCETDVVYLATLGFLNAGMIDGMLDNAGIKYLKRAQMGAWMTTRFGQTVESYNYFVLYSNFERAKDIIIGLTARER